MKFIEIINQFEVAINSDNIDKNDPWIEGIIVIFKNFEQIAFAKSEIFFEMANNGIVIIPDQKQSYTILKTQAEKAGIKKIFNVTKISMEIC